MDFLAGSLLFGEGIDSEEGDVAGGAEAFQPEALHIGLFFLTLLSLMEEARGSDSGTFPFGEESYRPAPSRLTFVAFVFPGLLSDHDEACRPAPSYLIFVGFVFFGLLSDFTMAVLGSYEQKSPGLDRSDT